MSDNKKLTFSISADAAEFNKTIDALQKKLNGLNTGTQASSSNATKDRLAANGFGSGATKEDKANEERETAKQRKQTDQFIREQVKDQEKIAKTLKDQLGLKEKLLKAQQEETDNMAKQLKLRKELEALESNIGKARAQMNAKESVINSALDRKENSAQPPVNPIARLANAYSKGGIEGAMTAGGRIASGMSLAQIGGLAGSAIAGVGGAIGAGVAGVGGVVGNYMQLPYEIGQNRASATNNNMTQFDESLAGKAYENVYYGKEAKEAKEQSSDYVSGQKIKDRTGLAGKMIGYASAGAGTGYAVGAGVGALAGAGIGAIPGAIMGGAIGGIGGIATGLYNNHEEILGQLGVGKYGERTKSGYQQMESEKYQQFLQQNKDLDPVKKRALEDFKANSAQNLSFMRSIGVGNTESASITQNGIDAGFTRSQTRDSSMGIMGAGGSTRGGRDLGVTALKYARDNDLTNSNQILGRLSGTMGTAKESDNSLIKILAEGTRLGFNKSEFVAENRKFTELVSNMAYSMGATTEGGAKSIASTLASSVADKSMRGLDAAQSAMQTISGLSSSTSGPRGALTAGALVSDKSFRNVGVQGKVDLQAMDLTKFDQLSTAEQEAYARQANVPLETFRKSIAEKDFAGSVGNNPQLKKNIEEMNKLRGNRTGTIAELSATDKKFSDAALKVRQSMAASEEDFGTTDIPTQNARREALANKDPTRAKELAKIPSGEIMGPKDTRAEDTVNKQAAAFDGISASIQKSFLPNVDSAAEAAKGLATEINKLVLIIQNAKTPEERAAGAKLLRDSMSPTAPVQKQVGPKSP